MFALSQLQPDSGKCSYEVLGKKNEREKKNVNNSIVYETGGKRRRNNKKSTILVQVFATTKYNRAHH